MTDPQREHQLRVELLEDDELRASLYEDGNGQLQLHFYEGPPAVVPVPWLTEIIARFQNDLQSWHRRAPQ